MKNIFMLILTGGTARSATILAAFLGRAREPPRKWAALSYCFYFTIILSAHIAQVPRKYSKGNKVKFSS